MNGQRFIDLDLEGAIDLIESNIKILGEEWLSRRLKKDDEERRAAQERNHLKLRIRHEARHPLVQWYREYLNNRNTTVSAHNAPISRSILLLANFCSNLRKAKNCDGVDHVIQRLIKPESFFAAEFEVEVAVSYINRGWVVAFIETGGERSPDLEVTREDGSKFWAECKLKEAMTKRDLANETYFSVLKDRLYKVWGPAKQNFALKIEFASDPEASSASEVYQIILEMAKGVEVDCAGDAGTISASVIDGRHRINLQLLARPDHSVPFQIIDYGGDSTEFVAEVMDTVFLGRQMKNPKVFDFRCETPPDKYQSAINSFNSAVGQIPESGPGVIWIRVPVPDGYTRAASDLERMVSKIKGELSGEFNRRVNAVVLSSRWFSHELNEGVAASSYRHASLLLEHSNPRASMF